MSSQSVVCVGAAVQDVFLFGKVLKAHKEDGQWVEQFPLGAKLDLDGIEFSTGGGATNGAVTFAKQGFKPRLLAKIGNDPAGEAIISDMKRHHINTELVKYSKRYSTGYSTLLVSPRGERSILTYRGASSHYSRSDFRIKDLEADWMFITSIAGNMDILEDLVEHGYNRHTKIAMIPGKGELKQASRLKPLLKKCEIVSANVEEMQMLFKGDSKEELAKDAAKHLPVAVVTDGPNGVAACDGKSLVSAGMYKDVPVIDRTGAGDAFSSGFVSWYALGAKLEDAVTFASANSTSVVSKMGAKAGILDKSAKIHSMPIKISELN